MQVKSISAMEEGMCSALLEHINNLSAFALPPYFDVFELFATPYYL